MVSSTGEMSKPARRRRMRWDDDLHEKIVEDLCFYHHKRQESTKNLSICLKTVLPTRIRNPALPRRNVIEPWDALNSVVYIRNPKLETQFEAMKSKFKSEGKVKSFWRCGGGKKHCFFMAPPMRT